jgi:hypothetical protein
MRVPCRAGAVAILAAGLTAGCTLDFSDCVHTTLAALRVQPDSVTLLVGQQVALQVVGVYLGTKGEGGRECVVDGGPGGSLAWQTSDSTLARITLTYRDKANFEGVRAGRVDVTVDNGQDLQGHAVILVSAPPP